MIRKTWFWLALTGLVISGCQKSSTEKNEAPAPKDSNVAESNAPVEPENSTKSTEVDLSRDLIAADLKSDAYEYYGLARTEPMKFMFKSGNNPAQTGSQTIKLMKAEKDFAEFELAYNNMPQMQSMTLRLDKNGIRISDAASLKQAEDSYELPTGLVPGKTWVSKTTPDSAISLNATTKVEGTGEVTTPVATYKDALIISLQGTGKAADKTFTMTMKSWLVKGKGTVRTEISNVSGGKTEKTILEEAK
jgi:hypothetical protein